MRSPCGQPEASNLTVPARPLHGRGRHAIRRAGRGTRGHVARPRPLQRDLRLAPAGTVRHGQEGSRMTERYEAIVIASGQSGPSLAVRMAQQAGKALPS